MSTTKEISTDPPITAEAQASANQARDERELASEFIAATSHDVRSPLGAINIFCEILLSDSGQLSEHQRANISMIAQAAQKLQLIVEDAVEIARIHQGEARLNVTPLDVRQLLASAIGQVEPLIRHKQLQIENLVSPEPFQLPGDSERLGQIVLRMLDETVACAEYDSVLKISDSRRGCNYALTITSTFSEEKRSAHRPEEQLRLRLRGKLGVRRAGESRYGLATAVKLAELLGGRLSITWNSHCTSELTLPLNRAGE